MKPELLRSKDAEAGWREAYKQKMFTITEDWLTLKWGGYEYDIEMSRIPTPLALLEWIRHVSEKSWEHTTPERISMLIEQVCARKSWNLHGAERVGRRHESP